MRRPKKKPILDRIMEEPEPLSPAETEREMRRIEREFMPQFVQAMMEQQRKRRR